jgi:tetratricopeptide (TPR) repeat protein
MKKILTLLFAILITLPASAQSEAAKLNKKAVELGNKGYFIDANSNFNKAITILDKETAKTIHNIGWLYELKGEPVNALLFYEEALRRNSEQLHSIERAGNLLYLLKQYDKSIVYGEHALKIDPLNKEVMTWLPDAYAQMFKLKGKVITQTETAIEQKKIDEELKAKQSEEKKYRRYITATYETTVRTSYLRAGGSGFHYTKTPAYGYNIPHMFTLDVTPFDSWRFKANTGVPYYGALIAPPVGWTEKAEISFNKKNYFLGIGFMGNHYKFKNQNASNEKLSDYKLGITFGKYEEKSQFDISFYPRMFPSDTGTAKGNTLDVDSFDVSYWTLIQDGYKFFWKLSLNDFYIFDNNTPLSNYCGVYSVTIGLGINDKLSSPYVVRLDVTERMYLENLANKRPYSYMNGQGMFGLDGYQWFKGKPMSGVKTFSTAFSCYVEERIIPRFFLFQKISAEIVGKKSRGNDFCITFGIGGYY